MVFYGFLGGDFDALTPPPLPRQGEGGEPCGWLIWKRQERQGTSRTVGFRIQSDFKSSGTDLTQLISWTPSAAAFARMTVGAGTRSYEPTSTLLF